MDYSLVAIRIDSRNEQATEVQRLLTDFGCHIRVRLGLHDLPDEACEPSGLLILQTTAPEAELKEFADRLNALDEVTARTLVF